MPCKHTDGDAHMCQGQVLPSQHYMGPCGVELAPIEGRLPETSVVSTSACVMVTCCLMCSQKGCTGCTCLHLMMKTLDCIWSQHDQHHLERLHWWLGIVILSAREHGCYGIEPQCPACAQHTHWREKPVHPLVLHGCTLRKGTAR